MYHVSPGLLGFLRMLAVPVILNGWTHSPTSWSPDGDWLSYTVMSDAEKELPEPGWLLRAPSATSPAERGDQRAPTADSLSPTYRIWATHRDRQPSVLIEESPSPLSAPAWSQHGKAVAFGRFIPESLAAAANTQRGRYEVVIQEGLKRKRIVWSESNLELDAQTRAGIPQSSCAWSPDGAYLAIPCPGSERKIEIVRTDSCRRIHTLTAASLPVWSPDGSKCAFIRHENAWNRLEYIERRAQSFGEPRFVALVGRFPTPACWNSDSRSLFTIVERTATRELEVMRFLLEPRESFKLLNWNPEPARKGIQIRGLALDFDRDAEQCFFAVDVVGRDADIVWLLPRERATIHKRFHPVDQSQRIADVAIAPDGHSIAVRLNSPRGVTPPLLYDCESEKTKLIVPDEAARREWLLTLVASARQILLASLPAAVVDGRAIERPLLLPLAGELMPNELAAIRLNRIGRFAAEILATTNDQGTGAERNESRAFDIEARLLFAYLRGDFATAGSELDLIEPLLTAPRERLSLLAARAQILAARGEQSTARAIIDYLLTCGDPGRQLVEETPLGLVFTPVVSDQQAGRATSRREPLRRSRRKLRATPIYATSF